MTRARALLAFLALAAAFAAPRPAVAQEAERSFDTYYSDGPSLRILRDYELRQGDTARKVVVIGGNARIEGHVAEDVVVVLGKVDVASTAVIDGTFVAVAGTVEIAPGAKVNRDFVVVGDAQVPPGFEPGGEHVVIGLAGFGSTLRDMVPWFTHGLLLGRPIVPSLGWVWMVAGIFFFLNLCLNLLFDGPVRTATTTLKATPFSAFIAGLLVLLLFGPVCALLAVSVIGIVVIPFVLCALLAAAILGRIAFARWLGMSLFPSLVAQDDVANRAHSTRSFLIGSALMCVVYMVPFVGFLMWILAGVFGLGAATLGFYSAYRRENPRPPKKAPVVPPPPAAPPVEPELSRPAAAVAAEMPPADLPPADPHAAFARVDLPRMDLPPQGASLPPEGASLPPEGGSYLVKAMFTERLAALALDAIAIAIIVQLLSLDRHGDPGERLMVLFALLYHVGFWTWRGTTPGGMICQLRVVRVDGKPLDFPESLVRGLTGIISLAVVGLGFLWMLRDPERQTWHDRVAGTYVVKVPRMAAI